MSSGSANQNEMAAAVEQQTDKELIVAAVEQKIQEVINKAAEGKVMKQISSIFASRTGKENSALNTKACSSGECDLVALSWWLGELTMFGEEGLDERLIFSCKFFSRITRLHLLPCFSGSLFELCSGHGT